MPISMPAIYEAYSKKKKHHKFNKKRKSKEKPYGWRDLTIKDVESRIQSILLKHNTRINNPRTWIKVKKDVQKYIDYLWSQDRHGHDSKSSFACVKCSLPETMSLEQVLSNQLIVGVMINLDTDPNNLMYLSFIQQQTTK